MKTYAIGDIHGCYDELMGAMDFIDKDSKGHDRHVYFLGDYVDRGPRSYDVVKYIWNGPQYERMTWTCLKGNHDDMLVRGDHFDRTATKQFVGAETLLRFLTNLPLYAEDKHRIYVHAGLMPGTRLEQNTEDVLLWIRKPFLTQEYDYGKLVVHGHTPTVDIQYYPKWRLNIDTGCCFDGKLTVACWIDDDIEPYFWDSTRMENQDFKFYSKYFR